MTELTYKEALEKAEHLIALDRTIIYLHTEEDFPWDKVTKVMAGCGHRLNGPTGVYFIIEEAGLSFRLVVDFEECDANGSPVSQFDRPRLRGIFKKLSPTMRLNFAKFLKEEVLPGLEKTTEKWHGYLNKQLDSEECVRNLILGAGR